VEAQHYESFFILEFFEVEVVAYDFIRLVVMVKPCFDLSYFLVQ